MINDKIQNQISGNDSVNFQAKEIKINTGLSYADVKQIVLDTFNSNFHTLKQEALELSNTRAIEFIEKFLSKIEEKEINLLNRFKDPDFLINFFDAQKAYAAKGYKFQMDLLIQMLMEKSKSNSLSTFELTVDESLKVITKLTQGQIDYLTIVLVLKNLNAVELPTENILKSFIQENIEPFISEVLSITDLVHLESIGCIHKRNSGAYIGLHSLTYKFERLFIKGFTKQYFENKVGKIEIYKDFLVPHAHNPELFQLFSMHQNTIQSRCQSHNLSKDNCQKIDRVYFETRMESDEIENYYTNISPNLKKLINTFNTNYGRYELSTTGVLISIINLKAKANQHISFEDCFRNRIDYM